MLITCKKCGSNNIRPTTIYHGYKCYDCNHLFVFPEVEIEEIQEVSKGEMKEFTSGALRAKSNLRGDLVCPQAFLVLSEVCHEGSLKYTDRNWEKGIPIANLIGHAIIHLCKFLLNEKDEPHLEHAFWNIHAAIHFTRCKESHEEWDKL